MPGPAGTYVTVHGLDELIDQLAVFGHPTHVATVPLETALAAGFVETQAVVHIISGRLKASGRTSSDFHGDTWTGSVEYGGPAGTPAYYGIYEMARGGTHDFLRPLDALDIGDAMSRWFSETLGGLA